ncbi:MAG TPA: hypothetical protein VJ741_20560, partial [Solirubrobacteraceae bacterium]|nr:hypothetical protein [Solirubrobacteraceae bacterium]
SVGDTIEVGGTTLVVRELPVPTAERTLKAVHPQPTVAPRSSSQETPSIARGPTGRPPRGLHAADQPPAEHLTNLSLTLHVDLTAREATVALGDSPEPIKLVFDGEAWRPASS